METSVGRLRIHDTLGGLLMLRSTVHPFFQQIEQLDSKRVVVDFSDVEFMSRSFADEYLSAKASSKKQVEETSVPVEAKRMLELVSRQVASRKSELADAKQATRRPTSVSL